MRCSRRWRRAVVRGVAVAALVGLGLGLAPAVAPAEEPAGSSTSGSQDGGGEGAGPTRPAPVTAPPPLLEALAAARQAGVGIGALDGRGVLPLAEELSAIGDTLGVVIRFLNAGHDVVNAHLHRDVDEVLVAAEDLRRAVEETLPAKGEVEELLDGTIADLSALADALVADLSGWAWETVTDLMPALPTAQEVLTQAQQVEAYLRGQADTTAQGLLAELGRIAAYLTDEQHQRTVTGALTTLLLTLAHNVNPLPDALAPTTEAGFDAAGAFVAWADALVTQQVAGPGPLYQEDPNTDTDDAPVSEDPTVVDGALAVGEVAREELPGPVYGVPPDETVPVPTADTSAAGFDCGMYPAQTCKPPVEHKGGRVIHKPIVRVVLAGTWWEGQSHLRGGLDNLFANLSGSGYQNILRQYWDRAGYIGPEVDYQNSHVLDVTPPAVVSKGTIASYAAQAADDVPGWRTNKSVVWVVALPPNAIADHPRGGDNKCGYQDYATVGGETYVLAVVDYPRQECWTINHNERATLTTIAAHEYVGAVTNPDKAGWRDGTGKHLPDLCQAWFVRGPGGEWVSQVWSNGDNGCVSSFTPRFAYRVDEVAKPQGDAGVTPGYTRGHSYPGALVRVTNTGNMPWLSFGAKRTYLATADNLCSPFADRSTEGGWATCRRIWLSQARVEPRSSPAATWPTTSDTTFVFALKPDGSFQDGEQNLVESFRLVAGTTWMANTGSRAAIFSDLDLNKFNAEADAVTRLGVVAVGEHGTTVTARVTLRNTGSAHWYPREVLYVGTDAPSKYRAANWPSATRAHHVGTATGSSFTVAPGASYTFDLTLRLPAYEKDLLDVVSFYPFADVPRVIDGDVSVTKVVAGRIDVRLVMPPKPLAAHGVSGYGFASGDTRSTPADESGFTCLAVAGPDTTETRITTCQATVTTAAGASHTYGAAAVSAHGPAALTSAAWTGYRPSDGDTISVCWAVEATFLDGSGGTHTGCG